MEIDMRNQAIICLSFVSGLIACSHESKKATAVATPAPATPPAARSTPSATASPRSCASDADCGDRQLCIRSQCVEISPDLAECSTVRVHFDFNDSNLHPDDSTKLVRMARCLKADHDLHVAIEGNADERGTEEWNIALGDKRATAVAQYLEHLGVSNAQLKTVSYGKERPLCDQHNEECWSKNRRAALKPQVSN
jgi:peptidoglycan-associated lipoprotein